MSNWQPIETAPEGKEILVYCAEENYYYVVFLEDGVFFKTDGEALDPDDRAGNEIPTHWMPLPAPPNPA